MKNFMTVIAAWVFLAAGPALAMSSDSSSISTELKEMRTARAMVKDKNYSGAVPLLKAVVKAQPQNADAWNLLAYSERKTDKLDDAMVHYMKALSIDPKHRDAHEYIGELYLRLGDLEGAKKHLKRLDDICTFGCEQFDELKEAIEAHGK